MRNLEQKYNKNLRILIVDDSEVMRGIIKKIVQSCGFSSNSIEEVDNGRKALKITEYFKPHIILCDYHMPILDGIKFAQSLKLKGYLDNTKILMISSDNTQKTHRKAKEAGISNFIGKPFGPETIKGALIEAINDVTSASAENQS